MFTRFLVVALACVVVAVSGKASNKNHWKQIAKDVKCKEGLNNLDLAQSLLDLLDSKKCPIIDMQCIAAYQNPFIDLALFQMETAKEEDDTFVIEVLCYSAPGKFTFGTANASFIEFVADTNLKKVTETQIDTFTFYDNIEQLERSDESFAAYYNAGIHLQPAFGLAVIVATLAPFVLQSLM
ncbi:uncharacterized protein LOC142349363 [Convolutriloba macropyga]|uniref:uncharacterized protein LOC142349363 n=1 Tax=Convolutriloba macropyga TaxID=536237 RepID=UPI003F524F69